MATRAYNAIVKTNFYGQIDGKKFHNITTLKPFIEYCCRLWKVEAIFFYDARTRQYCGFYNYKKGLQFY